MTTSDQQFPVFTRVKSVIRTVLFEFELVVFGVTSLLTGYTNLILSQDQTIRPFYPHDATLWYTYSGDTIETSTLFILYYFIVAPFIYYIKLHYARKKKHLTARQQFVIAARWACGMWNGTMTGILLVELLKGYVGRLRPSFAQACLAQRPPYPDNLLSKVFYTDADCPSLDQHLLHDMRRSFPSGHAALGLGGAVYIQLCLMALAREVNDDVTAMVLLALGWLFTGFGFAVGASRVVDAAHHVGDVAIGSLIGMWASAVQFWHIKGRVARVEQAFGRVQELQLQDESVKEE